MSDGPAEQASKLAVIGIGASAGGLEAVTRLLKAWPAETATAFILVQHQDPSGGSLMPALLEPHTALTVSEAEDGVPVTPGHLYVIPPGAYLAVAGGVLRLSAPKVRKGTRLPFDFLLQSLAVQYGPRAACVVLSGHGSDGSAGLRAIKARGGVVAVQDPAEAAYDGMPRSAIETGLADFVRPLADIPAALSAHRIPTAEMVPAGAEDADHGAVDARSHADILDLLRVETGHDFAHYKPGTLERRIGRRVTLAGLRPNDLGRYHAMLQADPVELNALAADLIIHVTSFFRDAAVFDALAQSFIPDLVRAHQPGQPLRVWVAGCSTGEEAYSLAILFLEQITAEDRALRLQVFASDVDAEAIAAARDGAYPAAIEASVSPARLARFFVREDAGWRVAATLRAAIVFTVQDILADPPFSRLDMVSCRNLLIYLRPDAQARVLDGFHFALRDGGILVLGNAECPLGSRGSSQWLARPNGSIAGSDTARRASRDPQSAGRVWRWSGPARKGA